MWRMFCAILAIASLAPPAQAQNDQWRHPRNLYSLQPKATGWQPWSEESDNTLASFELAGERQLVRMCFVRERPMHNLGAVTQAQLNERIDLFQPRTAGVSGAHVFMTDGVAVNAFRYDDPAGRAVNFYRTFVVVDGASVSHHEISCGGPPPITTAHETAFQDFLNSLHFPTDQAP